jgi:hypothetical protein
MANIMIQERKCNPNVDAKTEKIGPENSGQTGAQGEKGISRASALHQPGLNASFWSVGAVCRGPLTSQLWGPADRFTGLDRPVL